MLGILEKSFPILKKTNLEKITSCFLSIPCMWIQN